MVLAAPAWAQNPQTVAGVQTQVSECVLQTQGADLVACRLGLNSLGEISFAVKNRGTVGINTATLTGSPDAQLRTARTTEPANKIRMDLYVDDKLIQSVYQQALAGGELKEFTAKIPSNYPTPKCGETRALKLVIDPANQISEASEANNFIARTADRPCPDMEVESIKANYNDLKTEYVAEIKIVNKGNAPARFRYTALTSNSSAVSPLPAADFDKFLELDPGQTKKFTIGNSFSYSKMYVRVFLDRFSEVAELDESNNFKEKTLPE
jgi:hypothetical protein